MVDMSCDLLDEISSSWATILQSLGSVGLVKVAAFWIRKNIGREEFADHASNQVGSRSAIFRRPKYYQGRQFSNSQVRCF